MRILVSTTESAVAPPASGIPVCPQTIICCGACSITGLRDTNQDATFAWVASDGSTSPVALVAVADGVGGYAGGEIASRLAVTALTNTIHGELQGEERPDPYLLLLRGFRAANTAVAERAERVSELREMATTLTAAIVLDNVLYVAGIGDSRAYLLRGAELRQLTRDDSHLQDLVDAGLLSSEDAIHHSLDNFITRCLGRGEPLDALTFNNHELRHGDRVVLSSDGFHKFAESALAGCKGCLSPAEQACELVRSAYSEGSDDNITVAVLWFGQPEPRPIPRQTLSYW